MALRARQACPNSLIEVTAEMQSTRDRNPTYWFTYRLQIGGVSKKLEGQTILRLLERRRNSSLCGLKFLGASPKIRSRSTARKDSASLDSLWSLPFAYEGEAVSRQVFIKVARIALSSSLLSAGF